MGGFWFRRDFGVAALACRWRGVVVTVWLRVWVCGGVALWVRCGNAVAAVVPLWRRCGCGGVSAALRETPRRREAAPPLRLCRRAALPPSSEEEELPLDCREALGQVQDSVCFVATSFEYFVQSFQKRCNYAALR